MEIYFITSKKENNAPNQILKQIISELIKNGNKIIIFYFKDTKSDIFTFDKKYKHLVKTQQVNYNFLSLFDKRKYQQANISFSSGVIADLINIVFFKSKKKLNILHSTINKEYPIRWGLFFGYIFYLFHYYLLTKMNKIFLVSETQKKEMKLNKKINYKIIENGINFSRFNITNKNILVIKKKFKIPLNKRLFITVGNNDKVKQIKKLAKDFLKANVKETLLIIISKDIKIQDVENKIKVIKKTDKINEIFYCTDVFISYSKIESFNLSLVESYLSNNLYILSPIQRHLDFNKNHKNGVILKKLNSESLKKCIKELSLKFLPKTINNKLSMIYNEINMKKRYVEEIIE